MKKIFLPILIFVLVASAALLYQHQTVRGPSSISMDNNGPIQLPDSDVYSNESKKQIKRFLLRTLDWNTKTNEIGVPQFSIRYENMKINTDNAGTDFCTLYPTILLILEAPNISYSGEHPEMKVYGTCQNQNTIAKVEFVFETSNIRINNLDEDAPDKWRVKHFIFSETTKTPAKNIDITQYEILSVLGYSIEFPLTLKKQ
ncbi:MAG: hypothetical protein JNM24_12920 [Bdellovibrionaceae bacterium]|nr:hypothetical protein [Pseudobdellovibrionaceae bacterium]